MLTWFRGREEVELEVVVLPKGERKETMVIGQSAKRPCSALHPWH